MATEIDKTIEELEAEVLAELEEANGTAPNAPTKSATKAEPMGKIKPALAGDDKPEDMGKAVTDPKDATDPGKEASKKAKEVSGDAQQKGEGKSDAIKKIKEEDEEDKEDESKDKKDKEDEKSEDAHSDKEDEEQKEMSHDDMKEKMLKAMKHMKKEDMMKMYNSYHSAAADKTKDEMYQEMMHGMDKMKKDKMEKLHAAYMSDMAHGMKKEEVAKDEAVEARMKDINVQEDVQALMNADDSLSDEFKTKAATIFETAVKSKIRAEIKRLEEEYQDEVRSEIAETKKSLSEKVDGYLDYVVTEWMKENELAIERGLKGEIAEDFISGLKQLFEDHYIDVPAEKYDVLEAQADKISKLEKKLEETTQQVVEARRHEGSLIKESVKSEVTSDLTETEVEKFESLAKEVEFTDKDTYAEKLTTIKENYFPRQKPLTETNNDEVETGTAVQDVADGPMAKYLSAIGKSVKSAN